MTAVIILAWPSQPLWQNRKTHWAIQSRAIKKARSEAAIMARSVGLRKAELIGARLEWAFIPPDNRKRDLPNAIAAMKPHIDGIADALGIDDSTFQNHWPVTFETAAKGGGVRVSITPIARAVAA